MQMYPQLWMRGLCDAQWLGVDPLPEAVSLAENFNGIVMPT
jgi:hypothetical protein